MEELYNEKIAEKIVDLIREGKSEARICRMKGMPTAKTLGRWKKKYPGFLEATSEARRFSADLYNDRRMDLVDELIEKAREHEQSGMDFPKGTVDAMKAAMQELAREAAIRDDSRFSDRKTVKVDVAESGDGMAEVYAKMREAQKAEE